jgi:hypothetical protein
LKLISDLKYNQKFEVREEPSFGHGAGEVPDSLRVQGSVEGYQE